jgi:hypothetical protein
MRHVATVLVLIGITTRSGGDEIPDGGSRLAQKAGLQFVNGSFTGRVQDVTVDSITIIGDGIQCVGDHIIRGTKRYFASETLLRGEMGKRLGYGDMYRLKDVKTGDVVSIFYDRISDRYICTHIAILRRPGGRVPPSPGEPENSIFRHHERMNAQQDLEEKGIPLPAKYAPPSSAPHSNSMPKM